MLQSLGNQTQIQEKYNLTADQYSRMMKDVGNLSPQRQAAVTEAYVLTWKAFDESGDASTASLPKLKASDLGSVLELAGWTANAAYSSPGAALSALITELSAEQRKQNRDQYMAEADSISQTMKDQANDIREKADTQYTQALISGVINITAGVTSVVGSSISVGRIASAQANFTGEALSAQTQKIQQFSGIFQGSAGILQGWASIHTAYGQKQALMVDAEIKEKDAEIEQRRAVMESLRSLDQSLNEVIQKSLSTSEAIQQSMNQARSRILG